MKSSNRARAGIYPALMYSERFGQPGVLPRQFRERIMEISDILRSPNDFVGQPVRLKCIFAQLCGEENAYLVSGSEVDATIDAEPLYLAGEAIRVEMPNVLAEEILHKVHEGTTGIIYDFIGFCEIEGMLCVSNLIKLSPSFLRLPSNGEGSFEYRAK